MCVSEREKTHVGGGNWLVCWMHVEVYSYSVYSPLTNTTALGIYLSCSIHYGSSSRYTRQETIGNRHRKIPPSLPYQLLSSTDAIQANNTGVG